MLQDIPRYANSGVMLIKAGIQNIPALLLVKFNFHDLGLGCNIINIPKY
jgi:hypothetical protein